MAQALQARRDRLRRRPRRRRLQQPQGRHRASRRSPRSYSGFDEIACNTGAALDDGTPIGDGNPALKDKGVRAGDHLRHRHARRSSTGLRRLRRAGTTIIPPIYRTCTTTRARPTFNFDLAEANQMLDAGRLHQGLGRHPHDARTAASRSVLRLFGRSSSQTSKQTVQFVAGLAQGHRHRRRRSRSCPRTRSPRSSVQGNYDMFEWGWVVEPDPNYQLSTFTCANRSYKDGGSVYADLSDSFYCNKAVRRAVRSSRPRQIDPTQRAEIGQADAEDALRRRALRRDRLLRQPRGLPLRPVHQLPAAARARTARCSSSTAPYSYQLHRAGVERRQERRRRRQAADAARDSGSSVRWSSAIGGRGARRRRRGLRR